MKKQIEGLDKHVPGKKEAIWNARKEEKKKKMHKDSWAVYNKSFSKYTCYTMGLFLWWLYCMQWTAFRATRKNLFNIVSSLFAQCSTCTTFTSHRRRRRCRVFITHLILLLCILNETLCTFFFLTIAMTRKKKKKRIYLKKKELYNLDKP